MNPQTLRAFHANYVGSALLGAASRIEDLANLLREALPFVEGDLAEAIDDAIHDIPDTRERTPRLTDTIEGELAP